MAASYMGKVIFINLSTGETKEEELGEDIYRSFIGGYGLAARIIYERQKPKVNPLGEESILGFATGLLNGTGVPLGGRYMVAGKSPLTGTWGDANSGGYFGPELKATGYDAIFFLGLSKKPVYLWISDGKFEVRDASHLWGKDTTETEEAIQKELGDTKVRVACIGPAGETLSLISGIVNDKGRVAARSGLGAVMGAKRLKAIAVKGSKKVPVASKSKIAELRKALLNRLKTEDIPFYRNLAKYGTLGSMEANTASGLCPVKNWRESGLDAFPTVGKISDDDAIKYEVKKFACAQCPIACGGIMRVEEGSYRISEVHKVEYETLASFGSMCLNDNLESIIKTNDICNRYGLDTISAGATIAFAMECYENGLINKEDTEGIELIWGNAEAIVQIIEKMARREGFGQILADGAKVAAERIGKGAEKFAMHVHGQEMGYHNPIFAPCRGIGYLTDPTPGRHTVIGAAPAETGGIKTPHPKLDLPKMERYQYENKGKLNAIWSNYKKVVDCSGLCHFGMLVGEYPLPEFISAVTGWDFSIEETLLAGERIQTLRQCFNVREGLKPADFRIPDRVVGRPPQSKGPLVGITVPIERLAKDYFEAMGWDLVTGKPSEEIIRKLKLRELVGDLGEVIQYWK